MEKENQVCRLAIRLEGTFINAYIAKNDTMENALLVASLRKEIADVQPELFNEWREFLKPLITRFIFDLSGAKVEMFVEQKAPEHERAGHD